MRHISFRISDDEYEKLIGMLPCKPTSYFKKIAFDVINGNQKNVSASPSYDDEYLNQTVQTCLTESQRNTLEAAAKKHGWSLSREIRFRVQATLSNKLELFDDELFAFRQAKNAVNKVGINLHFILQKNSWEILDKEGFKQDLNSLQNEISDLKKQLDAYIKLGRGRQKINTIKG